jgi:hypothetical protein
MKQTLEMTAQPIFTELLSRVVGRENPLALAKNLKKRICAGLPGRREMLLTGGATLFLGGLFLAGSYLFLTQLAAYGWQ